MSNHLAKKKDDNFEDELRKFMNSCIGMNAYEMKARLKEFVESRGGEMAPNYDKDFLNPEKFK